MSSHISEGGSEHSLPNARCPANGGLIIRLHLNAQKRATLHGTPDISEGTSSLVVKLPKVCGPTNL